MYVLCSLCSFLQRLLFAIIELNYYHSLQLGDAPTIDLSQGNMNTPLLRTGLAVAVATAVIAPLL